MVERSSPQSAADGSSPASPEACVAAPPAEAEEARAPAADAALHRTPGVLRHAIDVAQAVLTALLLALVFRAFFVEAFIIPTGSMAPALLGAHGSFVCDVCGWEFPYGPAEPAESGAGAFVPPADVLCPNCHTTFAMHARRIVPRDGDRLLVHKWTSALPAMLPIRRWDVIVFRDPANPHSNYIKRVAGLPGESIEIVAGDVFINGEIVRKPDAAQAVMWQVVFSQDHFPRFDEVLGRGPRWTPRPPPRSASMGEWKGLDSRVLTFQPAAASADEESQSDPGATIVFEPRGAALYRQDVSGYNHGASGEFVGDVRLLGELTFDAERGACELELVRGDWRFTATIDADGNFSLSGFGPPTSGRPRLLAVEPIGRVPFGPGVPLAFELGHVDYRVYLKLNGVLRAATLPTQYGPDLPALRHADLPATVRLAITGRGPSGMALQRLRIERDGHYTSRTDGVRRGNPGLPFRLRAGEYFVLGDNSAHSHDSRRWTESGPHMPPGYRPGVVMADQIVGRAAFVYLPGFLAWDREGRIRLPDLGRMRFVR